MSISQIKIEKVLPKMTTGFFQTSLSIHSQWVKCGRKNCRCSSGKRADCHVAQYAFWRESGKLRKCYLSAADVILVQRFVDETRNRKKARRQQTNSTFAQWRDLCRSVRTHEATLQQQKALFTANAARGTE